MLEVTFCGAARTVTGSQYFLEYKAPDGSKFNFCVDSGLFQSGEKINLFKINSHLLFDPRKLDAVVLTHAHLDHCGRLPYLVKNGFGGKIYSSEATRQIAQVVMEDAAKLHTDPSKKNEFHELINVNNRLKSNSEKPKIDDEKGLEEIFEYAKKDDIKISDPEKLQTENLGLYTIEDVEQTLNRFKTFEYHKKFLIHPNLQVEFYDAGHILGSCYVVITELSSGKNIVFSGDLGNINKPIIEDPEPICCLPNLTHIFVETTYGNRLHGKQDPKEKLRKIAYETINQGGQVLLPAFSVERAQEVIYFLVELMRENKLPPVPIFLDSPMASKVLQICLEHPELYDDRMRDKIANKAHPLIYKSLKILDTPVESKTLNNYRKPCIIIAGSGMLNGGRILKHLYFHVEDPKNTILMVGYQAVGTLGRKISDGAKTIEVEDKQLEVKTKIEVINEFSAHADQKILKNWIAQMVSDIEKNVTVFLMHGERDASLTFGKEIETAFPSKIKSYWPHFSEKTTLWD